MHESKNLKDLTDRRVSKLRLMFNDYDIDVTGNAQYPSLIFDTDKLLFTYINNFDLHLLDDFSKTGYIPKTVLSYKIKEQTKIGNEFLNYLKLNNYWRKVYVIRHQETKLYLVGHTVDKDTWITGRILSPVFGLIKRKYYYDRKDAEMITSLYPYLPLEII
jgi:hypothetical protein